MFLVTAKPKLWSLKNRVTRSVRARDFGQSEVVVALFSAFVAFAVFSAVGGTLDKINEFQRYLPIHPSSILNVLLLILLLVSLFSSAAAALGALFFSQDLDLLMASPLTPIRFFSAKFLDVLMSLAWLICVFAVPMILAFGSSFQAPFSYYLAAVFLLLPLLSIPVSVAMIVVSLAAVFVPARRTREAILFVSLLAIGGTYLAIKQSNPSNLSDAEALIHLANLLSFPTSSWLPSHWGAMAIGEALLPSGSYVWPHILLVYSSAVFFYSLAFIAVRQLHSYAYSRTQGSSSSLQLDSRRAQVILRWLTPMCSGPARALFAKDVKLFLRDLTQAVQLIMLIGLCMIYLYNFRFLHDVEDLPASARWWWDGFLILGNLGMGGFVITAVATRFAFPALSLEGKAFWILASAPLAEEQLLRIKFWSWYIPTALISSVILGAGALAINAEPHIVAINALSSLIICYGIIGLAVGFGSLFANFKWDNSAQLSASYGSMLYMLSCFILIFLDMFPIGLIISLRIIRNMGVELTQFQWYLGVATAATLLIYLNHCATNWAIKAGANAIRAQRERPEH